MKLALAPLSLLFLTSAAHAASLSIDVHGPDGAPLAGAVVAVTVSGAEPPPVRGPYAMAQQNISFQPHVLIVPVGASVAFPNLDKVRHHVYSFSKTKKFDLKLYGKEDKRVVLFDRPGVVTLGCNIHDRMSGIVFVTATRFTILTDAGGHAAFSGVPQGKATLTVWHPFVRGADNVMTQPLDVAAAAVAKVVTVGR